MVAARAGRRAREISDRYLSEQERVRIADLRQAGNGVWGIAEQTGRSTSTISGNCAGTGSGQRQYRPFTAHKLAVRRRAGPRPAKIAADPVLRQLVQERLEKRWSPEQVSQAPRVPDKSARHVVHETIYQAVYRPELTGLSRELPAQVLRTVGLGGARLRWRLALRWTVPRLSHLRIEVSRILGCHFTAGFVGVNRSDPAPITIGTGPDGGIDRGGVESGCRSRTVAWTWSVLSPWR